jgi:hypothetical protein
MHATQRIQHLPNLSVGQHHRQALRRPGTHAIAGTFQRLVEDSRVEEQQRGERLVLRRRRNVILDRQVGQKRLDLR